MRESYGGFFVPVLQPCRRQDGLANLFNCGQGYENTAFTVAESERCSSVLDQGLSGCRIQSEVKDVFLLLKELY